MNCPHTLSQETFIKMISQLFFSYFIFNWRILALQCCAGCTSCTTTWISCKNTYIPLPLESPSHPSPTLNFFRTTQDHFGKESFPFPSPSLYFHTSRNNVFQLMKTEMYVLQAPTRAVTYLLEMQLTYFPETRKPVLETEILVSWDRTQFSL